MTVSLKHRLEFAALWMIKSVANALPAGGSQVAGAAVGRLIGRLWRFRRGVAQRNIEQAFPDFTPSQTARVVNGTFANIGRTTFEILRFDRAASRAVLDRVDTNGTAPLELAVREGQGVLLLSAHFGNWEVYGAWVRALGYPVDVVVKPMRNPLSDRLYNARRAVHDVGIIPTQIGTSGIVRAIKKRRFVAMLVDQYAGREGVEVEFFGRPASTPRGPAVLALKYGCSVLIGVLVRKPDGRFLALNDGPLEIERTGDDKRDVKTLTQKITSRLEEYIRAYPDQWLWTHRRWGA